MSKNIITIGFSLASDKVHDEDFSSKISLLDWDIILFRPKIDDFISSSGDSYQGKPALNDRLSFQLREACEHWRREIKQAVDIGKTVLIFLTSIQEVHIETGERTYSGIGRNQKTTRIVELYSNYNAVPVSMKFISTTGSAMKLAPLGIEILAPFWAEFGSLSEYKVLLPLETVGICLTTKDGDKPVGAMLRSMSSSGTLVLLPEIEFEAKAFVTSSGGWTSKAKQFAARATNAVVALDKALHSSAEVTPEPSWVGDQIYILAIEQDLRSELLDAERQVEEAQNRKESISERLEEAGRLRGLLYEKGRPLENAIIKALRLLGFQAAPYRDTRSEFDVVFECDEGRLLGEAEGKDTKAINIDKLRQLTMNIHEDLMRDDVETPAKGVLFGNGFRLILPQSREVQFTGKCVSAALSSSIALIATSDLYSAAQYISNQEDGQYAKLCRETILTSIGVVNLPLPPSIVLQPANISR